MRKIKKILNIKKHFFGWYFKIKIDVIKIKSVIFFLKNAKMLFLLLI